MTAAADHTRSLFAAYKRIGQDIACRTSGAEQDGEPENVGEVVRAMREQYRMLAELLGLSARRARTMTRIDELKSEIESICTTLKGPNGPGLSNHDRLLLNEQRHLARRELKELESAVQP